jgi:hypothetical protein
MRQRGGHAACRRARAGVAYRGDRVDSRQPERAFCRPAAALSGLHQGLSPSARSLGQTRTPHRRATISAAARSAAAPGTSGSWRQARTAGHTAGWPAYASSIPARRAYSTVNSAVSCRGRAAWIASWKACGRTVSWRGASLAWVHAGRTGQARQVAAWKRMRTTASPETSRPGVHLTLVCPWGQRACCACHSITTGSKRCPTYAQSLSSGMTSDPRPRCDWGSSAAA